MERTKVLVGLSGGTDSSVTAFLLNQQGYDVTGVTMAIWEGEALPTSGKNTCYGPDEIEDIEKAEEVCRHLGIPYRVFDLKKEYKQIVLSYFQEEYLQGRTPNPCIKCNRFVKLGVLPNMARKAGMPFEKFATGHYARIGYDADSGRHLLLKGVDEKKDQSYFLHRLSQSQLAGLLFPLGEYTKAKIKQIAVENGIPVDVTEESQDFYKGDYKDLLHVEDVQGNIVNKEGLVLGQHNGIWNYTIGQRKGLGIAHSEPLYVVGLDKIKNEVVVGTKKDVLSVSCILEDLNWISQEGLEKEMDVFVKIRSNGSAAPATIQPEPDSRVRLTFIEPQEAITPGQSAVFYEGDVVVGGGVIREVC